MNFPSFSNAHRERGLQLLMIASILGTFSGALFTPFYVSYVLGLGGSVMLSGAVSSLFFLTAGLAALQSPRFVQRFGARNTVMLGFATILAGDILLLASNSLFLLAATQLVLGAGLALTNPAWSALALRLLRSEEAPSYYSRLEFSYNACFAAAGFLGGFIIDASGYPALFFLKILLHAGSLAACMMLAKEIV